MSKITAMYIRLSMEDEDVSLNQNRGRWHMEQGEQENAYKLFEEVIFTEYNRSSLVLA